MSHGLAKLVLKKFAAFLGDLNKTYTLVQTSWKS